MVPEPQISSVAYVIQLSVAPVFLVSGVAGLLAVLTSRLGRIVDRARKLEAMLAASPPKEEEGRIRRDLTVHARRAGLIHWAISLCTTCALMICLLIALLFIGTVMGADLSRFVIILFILAMGALIGGLVTFLREIHTGIAALELGPGEQGEAVVKE